MKTIVALMLSLVCLQSQAQQKRIEVADLTLKIGIGKTEVMHYGFEKEDEIIFNFEDQNGKPITEIEILEGTNNSKFKDFKTASVSNKRIKVNQRSVYSFIFKNTAALVRIVNVKIERIPSKKEHINFNTNWVYKTVYDTSYLSFTEDSLVGYDTTKYTLPEKKLVKTELKEEMLLQRTEKVHSSLSLEHSNKTTIIVDFPMPKKEAYKEEKVISWAYWIGVGQESRTAFAENIKNVSKLASTTANLLSLNPLVGFAIGTVGILIVPTSGDDVNYAFISDYDNAQAFMNSKTYSQFQQGKSIAAYGKMDKMPNGRFYIGLLNDNAIQAIDVDVKIAVIKEVKTYQDVDVPKFMAKPKYVTVSKKKSVITESQIMVNAPQLY